MKTTLGQYCINVSDLERAVAFYAGAIGLEITNRIEEETFREVILGTPDGARIQLAHHSDQEGPIEHGNAFWKHYVYTDDCNTIHERAVAAGGESVLAPQRLERWRCTVAMVKDPDGYQLEIIQRDD
jgi:lactoylglutathione lyase